MKQKYLKPSFKDAKWDKYRGIIYFNINEANLSTVQIDSCIEKFEKLLFHAENRAIPMKATNKYSITLTPDIKHMIGERNKYNRIWQRTRDHAIKTIVNKLTNKIKKRINALRNLNWNNKLSQLEPSNQSLWQVSKLLKNKNRFIPPLKLDDGSIALTNDEKANVIADQFVKNHQNPLADNNPVFENDIKNVVDNFFNSTIDHNEIIYPTVEKVQDCVKKLKNSKVSKFKKSPS